MAESICAGDWDEEDPAREPSNQNQKKGRDALLATDTALFLLSFSG